MKDELIKFETAKLAKSKGFHWMSFRQTEGSDKADPLAIDHYSDCVQPFIGRNFCYNEKGMEITPNYYTKTNNHYPRPTQSLLQRWLREKHQLIITIDCFVNTRSYLFKIILGSKVFFPKQKEYCTYEIALETALMEALQLVETK